MIPKIVNKIKVPENYKFILPKTNSLYNLVSFVS